MTKKFITIESSDVASRHQLRSSLEELVLRRYGKKVMVIGMEYFPYNTFGSDIEDAVMKAASKNEISQYTALFSNVAIFTSINDIIMNALSNDIPVICVGHLTQFTTQAVTRDTVGLFGPIADSGLFAEPCKMIHLLHNEEKWDITDVEPQNENMARELEALKSINKAFAQTVENLGNIEGLNDATTTLYFEDYTEGNIMEDIMKEIDAVIAGPEPLPIQPEQKEERVSEETVTPEAVDESDISFEEA